jgi:hypothetical protein
VVQEILAMLPQQELVLQVILVEVVEEVPEPEVQQRILEIEEM